MHTLVRNAHVVAQQSGKNLLITVNDLFQHEFDVSSRYSNALRLHAPEEIAERLKGGNFFFVGDELVDFREKQATTFVHSNENIDALMQHVGSRHVSGREKIQFNQNGHSQILLNKHWMDNEFHAEGYQDGGLFTTNVSFTWSPFAEYVRGVFQLVRQICENGMVASTNFVNSRVPLVNRWVEHLDIAAHQIHNKANDQIRERVKNLQHERASLRELMVISEHADSRLQAEENLMNAHILTNIRDIADPRVHAAGSYSDEVFSNQHLASQLPGHLTAFDAWNLVTEMSTHTSETADSSVTALQRIANSMVFDDKNRREFLVKKSTEVRKSAFSDPNAAFFGTMQ